MESVPTGNPREYVVELPGVSMAVLEWGPAAGPLLVAVHGFPDTAWTWRHVAPALAGAGWRVVAPFLRGYAPTDQPADGQFTAAAAAADLKALHAALSGDSRAVFVGHDWGALIGMLLAGDRTSPYALHVGLAVPPLAYLNPTRGTLKSWLRAVLRQPTRSWYIAFNQLPTMPVRHFERLVTHLWRAWSPGYDARQDLAHLRDAVPTHERAGQVVSYYRTLASRAITDFMVEPIRPMLYLHGGNDGCMDARFLPALEARLPPHVHAVAVADAGHFLQLERPDWVGEQILTFIGRPAGATVA